MREKRSLHAVLDGKKVVPIDSQPDGSHVLKWARMFENIENRRVARTVIDDTGGIFVSTVFLGINHGFGGRPLWFETMIFGGPHTNYQDRYETWDEAHAGHEKAVKIARGELKDE